MKWVCDEIAANRIESVSITKDPRLGDIGLLVKWRGPGLISTWISGNTIEECFQKLEKIDLPSETWVAMLANKGQIQNSDAEVSFDQYLKSVGVLK